MWFNFLPILCYIFTISFSGNHYIPGKHRNLKKLRDHNGKFEKHNLYFKLLYFQTKFILWHIKLNIYMQEIKFTSQKPYLFGRLLSRNQLKLFEKVDMQIISCRHSNGWNNAIQIPFSFKFQKYSSNFEMLLLVIYSICSSLL